MPTAMGAARAKFKVVVVGAYVPSPAWVARIVQLPTPTIVTVAPETVQRAGVALVYVTGRPELLVAAGSANVAPT
jgi:hypothetical protein